MVYENGLYNSDVWGLPKVIQSSQKGVHEMNCMDCPFVRRAFMVRECALTGKHVPLFSAPHECPMNQDKEDEK